MLEVQRTGKGEAMSYNVQTSATIASLRAEVERLKAELVEAESDRNRAWAWCAGQDVMSDFKNAGEMRVALDTARERAGVLEAEVKGWRVNAGGLSNKEPWHIPHREMRITDRRNALDAAKFGKEKNDE